MTKTTNTQRFQDIGAYRIENKTPVRSGHILHCSALDGNKTVQVYADAKPEGPALGGIYDLSLARRASFYQEGKQLPVLGRFSGPGVV